MIGIAAQRDEARIAETDARAGAVDEHAWQHAHRQRIGERRQTRVLAGFGQPEHSAAALDPVDDFRRDRRGHGRARIGDHEQIGVVGDARAAAEHQRHAAHALVQQQRGELGQIRVGHAVGLAFAVAGQERDHALLRARQAQQRVGEFLLVEPLQPFVAAAIAQLDLAVDTHAERAHRGGSLAGSTNCSAMSALCAR